MPFVKRFRYEADIMRESKGHSKVVPVFNNTVMQGVEGVTNTIHLPKGAPLDI